jgi:hypothetical protein
MYYNTNNQMLVNNYPKTVTLSNGTIVTGDNFDTSILTNAGYLTVRSDTPTSPENSIEDVSQRVVNIDGDFVDVVRTWIPVPIIIPETISARQVRLWLIQNGILLSQVEDAINTITDPLLRESTRVEWEYAPYIERNHPLIESLAQYLGLTPEQIDQGFVIASQL